MISNNEADKYLADQLKNFIDKDELELERLNVSDQTVYIGSEEYSLSYWVECFSSRRIFLMELRKKIFILEKVHTIGLDLNSSPRKVLCDTDLWELGLG